MIDLVGFILDTDVYWGIQKTINLNVLFFYFKL